MISFNETIENQMLEKHNLLNELTYLGFLQYIPRCSSWKHVYLIANNTSTIFFLIGKHGIDFKYYNYIREIKVDVKNKLYTDGGKFVRNYYNKSKIDIHFRVLEIANSFVQNIELSKDHFNGLGTSPLSSKRDQNDEMVAIYNSVCHEYGEDAYLSDGVYIRPDGSMYEE